MTATHGGVAHRADILRIVREYHVEHRYGPSLRDVAAAAGLALSTVAHHVDVLVAAGELECDRGKPRSLRIVEDRE